MLSQGRASSLPLVTELTCLHLLRQVWEGGPGVREGQWSLTLSTPQAASAMMEHRPMSLKLLMTLMFTTMGQRAFMNRTVGEVLWGYDDPLLDLMDKYFPGALPFKGKFGLFSQVSSPGAPPWRWSSVGTGGGWAGP